MERRKLASLEVSEVGLGCNNFAKRLDQDAATMVVNGALDAGVNFFDTSDTYGATLSEVFLGRALGARRGEVIIATKFGMPLDDTHFGASPQYVRSACEDSLRRLNTEYIDLYQLHHPDDTVPIADTLGALQQLVAEGKVREIGCSNFTADQLREAKIAAGEGSAFVSVQNQFSLLGRYPERDGVLEACAELGIGFLPFYPLANGLLTGKIRPGEPLPEGTRLSKLPPEQRVHWLSDELQRRVGSLLEYAETIDTPILSIAFSWLLSHPAVASVIAGASSKEQIHANVASVTRLTPGQIEELNRLTA
ncbi:MAG: Aldo/keto reductase [Acidimicrobiaceae bacterium]|nr:Aldo/keto reductase [Acidimicrobiaceae bacterium]